jgi:hypothetical protein
MPGKKAHPGYDYPDAPSEEGAVHNEDNKGNEE